MSNIKVTIIILDYMKAERVVENVESILRQSVDFGYKIIVIDNSCNPANAATLLALEHYPEVTLLINNRNIGYSRAHNAVNHMVEGEYVFIVNPDIVWHDRSTLKDMVDYMDRHPDIFVLGPKQVDPIGRPVMTVRAFPKMYLQVARRTFLRKLPWLKNKVAFDEMQHLDHDKTQEVDWLQSSFVAVRTDFWREAGGFNEKYFLFMADVELCLEAWKRGGRVVYYPKATVGSDGKRVSRGGFWDFFGNWVLRQHLLDSWRYRIRHLREGNPRV